jgi:RHS repeat-associated protein
MSDVVRAADFAERHLNDMREHRPLDRRPGGLAICPAVRIRHLAEGRLGRRVSATRSGTATAFLYSDWEVAQEQQSGRSSADLIIGPGYDQRFARAGATYLVDALGSTLGLAASGAVKTNYGYDPYGVSQTTGTASTNTFQFTGRENDGTGLLNYRARYYNPAWGRFLRGPRGAAGRSQRLCLCQRGSDRPARPLGINTGRSKSGSWQVAGDEA